MPVSATCCAKMAGCPLSTGAKPWNGSFTYAARTQPRLTNSSDPDTTSQPGQHPSRMRSRSAPWNSGTQEQPKKAYGHVPDWEEDRDTLGLDTHFLPIARDSNENSRHILMMNREFPQVTPAGFEPALPP